MQFRVSPRNLAKLAVALYLLSLASPCAVHDGYPADYQKFGIEILFQGWLGILMGELHWYANLLFFYVVYRVWTHRRVPAAGLFSAALGVAAVTLFFPVVQTSIGKVTLSPYLALAKEVRFGTYLWAAGMVLGAILCLMAPDRSSTPLRDEA